MPNNNKSTRRRARKQREAPQKIFWRSTHSKWQSDPLNDSGLDVVLQAGDAHTTRTSEVVLSVSHTADSVKETISHVPRSLAASRDNPMSIGFFDLPSEVRTYIYELYCLRITQPASGTALRTQLQRAREINDTLKPKLICHQFRDEYGDVWAGVAMIELPGQTMQRSHISTGENNRIDRHDSIQHLFILVRNWLDEAPSYLRHRLRHLRVTYKHAAYWLPRNSDMNDFLQHIRSEDIANLMERLDDVHPQLCIEVRIFAPKYWDLSRHGHALQIVEFALKQQTPEKVSTKGGAEWVCVNRNLTVA